MDADTGRSQRAPFTSSAWEDCLCQSRRGKFPANDHKALPQPSGSRRHTTTTKSDGRGMSVFEVGATLNCCVCSGRGSAVCFPVRWLVAASCDVATSVIDIQLGWKPNMTCL